MPKSLVKAATCILLLAFTGCGQPSRPTSAKSWSVIDQSSREELLAKLVAKADLLADGGDFGRAEAVYKLAELYSPDPAIPAKVARIAPKVNRELTEAQSKRIGDAMGYARMACEDWPDPPPDAEMAELRLLVHDRLFRDHRRMAVPDADLGVELFIGLDNGPVHVRELERVFGPPTSRRYDQVLTYGRLRFVTGRGPWCEAIFLRPVKRR